jgi:predicted transposase YdaD
MITYLEWEQRTKQQGGGIASRSLVLRQLARRVGELPETVRSDLDRLSLTQLEDLGEALLDFSTWQI